MEKLQWIRTAPQPRLLTIRMQGPPPGVTAGGPPPGVATSGAPPGGGPPGGGPPAGGPPPRTPIQKLLDSLFEVGFRLLYAFEPEGMLDSSKNLRVLWVRALLNSAGELKDDVALQLLPRASRWIVSPPFAPIWAPAMEKLDWIRKRTEFIDRVLDDFLAAAPLGQPLQCVLIGAGYDTRALRFRRTGLAFFEVDLPAVLPIKRAMSERYLQEQGEVTAAQPVELGADLNEAAGEVLARLAPLGFDRGKPTLVVCEAVLFYLSPPAKQKLIAEWAALLAEAPRPTAIVMTDNFAPFLRSPQRADAEEYFGSAGLRLLQHDTIWGGAIQFVHAVADSE